MISSNSNHRDELYSQETSLWLKILARPNGNPPGTQYSML